MNSIDRLNSERRNFTSNHLVTSQSLTDADEIETGITSHHSDAEAVLFLGSEVVLAVDMVTYSS